MFICKRVMHSCTLLGVIISTRDGFSILLSRGSDIEGSLVSVSIKVRARGCTTNTSMSALSAHGHFTAAAAALLTLRLTKRNMTLKPAHRFL